VKNSIRTLLVSSAIALLAACGGAAQDNNASDEQMSETPATTQAANPFSDAEQQMSEKMMSAVGADVGDNWAKKMIAHHQGAIDMSEIVLDQNPKPDVAEMARMSIEKQRKDIEDIQKLVKNGGQDQKSADLYRPAMMDMKQKMQAAMGSDASETFMRKMLEHHKGAVAMSDVALQNGVSGAMRAQVQKTRDENQKEAEMTEAMLRGETMQHAMQQSGAKSAEQAKAEPAPADKAKAEPKVAPKPAAQAGGPAAPKAEPKAPAASCLPEHRAAGHC
jgi:uncharacterized protein (DUF305 family)